MPPNHFESEVESFLEGSHGDRTHIKQADHPRLHHYAGRYFQAKNSLNTLVKQGTLFTYLNPALDLEGDPIARTSNLIEGGINTQLRCMLVA